MKAVRFTVHGRVQGVWFRASTQAAARRLGVVGWVANEADGSVVGEASGAEVSALIDWLHQGPTQARVTSVEVTPIAPLSLSDFEIRR